MFRCYSYTIIRERINLCLQKLQWLKEPINYKPLPDDGVTVTPKHVGAALMKNFNIVL